MRTYRAFNISKLVQIQRVLFKSYRYALIKLNGDLKSSNKPRQPNKYRSLNYPKFSDEILKVTAKHIIIFIFEGFDRL